MDGEFVPEEEKASLRQTVSAETSAKMREMLYGTRTAMRNNGTDPAGYFVGGKRELRRRLLMENIRLIRRPGLILGLGGRRGNYRNT